MRILVLSGLFILFASWAYADEVNPDPARFTDCIDLIKDFPRSQTRIYWCHDKKYNRSVVIKALANNEEQKKIFDNEMEIYALTSDIFGVVKFYEQMADTHWLYAILEYCETGDFFNLICKNKDGLSEKDAKVYFRQLAATLSALHDKKIVHLDIKSENFFLSYNSKLRTYVVKIGDFGLSENLQVKEPSGHKKGTRQTMAPELYSSTKFAYDPFKADAYSLGIFLFTALFGHPPYGIPTSSDKFFEYVEKYDWRLVINAYDRKRSFKHLSLSPKVKDLLVNLLNFDPQKRLSMKQVLAHPWLK